MLDIDPGIETEMDKPWLREADPLKEWWQHDQKCPTGWQ